MVAFFCPFFLKPQQIALFLNFKNKAYVLFRIQTKN